MANAKEAQARIKINKLLESAGWQFFNSAKGKANVTLEPNVKLSQDQINDLGDNFESTKNGFVDFLLLDEKSFPLVVLEAKSEDKNPLVGKEQARKYAKSLNCRFVILSNGNLHYFWDLQQGNPHIITSFPTPDSLKSYQKFEPDQKRLITEAVGRDYIVQTQQPGYEKEAGWINVDERPAFIAKNKLRFLRDCTNTICRARILWPVLPAT
ncbi:type I restriction endonuclease [Bordetella sp. 2513F-2]